MTIRGLLLSGLMLASSGVASAASLDAEQVALIQKAGLDVPGPEAVALAESTMKIAMRLPEDYRSKEILSLELQVFSITTADRKRCRLEDSKCAAALNRAASEVFDRWFNGEMNREIAVRAVVYATGMTAEQMVQAKTFVDSAAGEAFVETALEARNASRRMGGMAPKIYALLSMQKRTPREGFLADARAKFLKETARLPQETMPIVPPPSILPIAPPAPPAPPRIN